jgi:hypothetical protein
VLAEQEFSGLLDDRQALGPVVNDVDRDLGDLSGAGAGRVEGAAEVGEDWRAWAARSPGPTRLP